MKATLIFPGINLGGWNSFSKAGANENFVPYGLAYIAAYAKSCGHVIDLIDLRRLTGWGEFDAMVKDRAPGVFGISSMSVDFSTAAEAARRIKNADKLSTVVLGGVHATVASHEVELLASVDHIISGEGEISFSNLLSSIEAGVKCERIIRGIPPDIRALPYPDRDLFSYRDGESAHPWLSFMEGPFVSIIAGRGCPFSCAFCQPAERLIFGGRAKVRDTKSIIDDSVSSKKNILLRACLSMTTFLRLMLPRFLISAPLTARPDFLLPSPVRPE